MAKLVGNAKWGMGRHGIGALLTPQNATLPLGPFAYFCGLSIGSFNRQPQAYADKGKNVRLRLTVKRFVKPT